MGIHSEYLDLGLGLAVVFFLASLIVSGLNEGFTWATKIRAKFLWAWLHEQMCKRVDNRVLSRSRAGTVALVGSRQDVRPRIGADGAVAGVAAAGDAAADDALAKEVSQRLVVALAPLEAVGKAGARTTIKNVPSTSLVEAFLEVLSDIGRRELATSVFELFPENAPAEKVAEAPHRLGSVLAGSRRSATEIAGIFTAYASSPVAEAQQAAETAAHALVDLDGAVSDPTLRDALEKFAMNRPDPKCAEGVISALGRVFNDVMVRQRIETAIGTLNGTPLAATVKRLWDTSTGELDKFRTQFESWVNGEFNRLSGFYKRSIRWFIGAFALVVAIGLNVDTIGLTRSLWRNPTGHAAIAALAEQIAIGDSTTPTTAPGSTATTSPSNIDRIRKSCEKPPDTAEITSKEDATAAVVAVEHCITDSFNALSGLSVVDRSVVASPDNWWDDFGPGRNGQSFGRWFVHLIGVLITAMALFLGAPFWLDIIKRLTGLRRGLVGQA
jgi:hypothetical protein